MSESEAHLLDNDDSCHGKLLSWVPSQCQVFGPAGSPSSQDEEQIAFQPNEHVLFPSAHHAQGCLILTKHSPAAGAPCDRAHSMRVAVTR